jgi:hypothetical protein
LRPIQRPEDRPPVLGPGDDRRPLPLEPPSLISAEPGSYPDDGSSYPSLLEFARARLPRIHSRERDFGLRWGNGTAIYRAAWIEDTGELYIVQLGPPASGGGHVRLLAAGADLEQVERALAGWQDIIDDSASLNWLLDRVSRHLNSQVSDGTRTRDRLDHNQGPLGGLGSDDAL